MIETALDFSKKLNSSKNKEFLEGYAISRQRLDKFLRESSLEKKLKIFPRTELGRRLWELRRGIISSGLPLLGWDDIEKEIKERRGERE